MKLINISISQHLNSSCRIPKNLNEAHLAQVIICALGPGATGLSHFSLGRRTKWVFMHEMKKVNHRARRSLTPTWPRPWHAHCCCRTIRWCSFYETIGCWCLCLCASSLLFMQPASAHLPTATDWSLFLSLKSRISMGLCAGAQRRLSSLHTMDIKTKASNFFITLKMLKKFL